MSVPLPAVNGTTNLMLCFGQSCACACACKLKPVRAKVVKANFKKPEARVLLLGADVFVMLSPDFCLK